MCNIYKVIGLLNQYKDIVILAGGVGVRTKQNIPKPLLQMCGKTLLELVIEKAKKLSKNVIAVISPEIKKLNIKVNTTTCIQENRDGSGGALKRAIRFLKSDSVLVLYVDVPCFEVETINDFLDFHFRNNYDASIISIKLQNPKGYGRVIKNNGVFVKIVEENEATTSEKNINEVNTGICVLNKKCLKYLKYLKKHNNEYYLTDLFSILKENGFKIGVYNAANAYEFIGINNLNQLEEVRKIINSKIIGTHRENGVIIEGEALIDMDVKIKPGTKILNGSIIKGTTKIGSNCTIGPYTYIENSKILDNTIVMYSHIVSSIIGSNNIIGPYARLRPGTKIGNNCKIGNFVEIKKSIVNDDTKVPHLSYIGDAYIGSSVNIGAGVITCN
ncbi:MAG: NTP transferase domain-containing protein, partial [bacterium]|nr:NTP transferase domain-containing protein [bacterium]